MKKKLLFSFFGLFAIANMAIAQITGGTSAFNTALGTYLTATAVDYDDYTTLQETMDEWNGMATGTKSTVVTSIGDTKNYPDVASVTAKLTSLTSAAAAKVNAQFATWSSWQTKTAKEMAAAAGFALSAKNFGDALKTLGDYKTLYTGWAQFQVKLNSLNGTDNNYAAVLGVITNAQAYVTEMQADNTQLTKFNDLVKDLQNTLQTNSKLIMGKTGVIGGAGTDYDKLKTYAEELEDLSKKEIWAEQPFDQAVLDGLSTIWANMTAAETFLYLPNVRIFWEDSKYYTGGAAAIEAAVKASDLANLQKAYLQLAESAQNNTRGYITEVLTNLTTLRDYAIEAYKAERRQYEANELVKQFENTYNEYFMVDATTGKYVRYNNLKPTTDPAYKELTYTVDNSEAQYNTLTAALNAYNNFKKVTTTSGVTTVSTSVAGLKYPAVGEGNYAWPEEAFSSDITSDATGAATGDLQKVGELVQNAINAKAFETKIDELRKEGYILWQAAIVFNAYKVKYNTVLTNTAFTVSDYATIMAADKDYTNLGNKNDDDTAAADRCTITAASDRAKYQWTAGNVKTDGNGDISAAIITAAKAYIDAAYPDKAYQKEAAVWMNTYKTEHADLTSASATSANKDKLDDIVTDYAKGSDVKKWDVYTTAKQWLEDFKAALGVATADGIPAGMTVTYYNAAGATVTTPEAGATSWKALDKFIAENVNCFVTIENTTSGGNIDFDEKGTDAEKAQAQAIKAHKNVVVIYTPADASAKVKAAKKFVLKATADYKIPFDIKVKDMYINRTIKADNYRGLFLPFDIKKAQFEKLADAGINIYAFSGVTEKDVDGATEISFGIHQKTVADEDRNTEKIIAYAYNPYMVKGADIAIEEEISVGEVELKQTPATTAGVSFNTALNTYTFKGTNKKQENPETAWVLGDNSQFVKNAIWWVNPSNATDKVLVRKGNFNVGAVQLTMKTNTIKYIFGGFVDEDDVTAVKGVETEAAPAVKEGIYTIQGIKVNSMDKPGLYIVNGKKVLKK